MKKTNKIQNADAHSNVRTFDYSTNSHSTIRSFKHSIISSRPAFTLIEMLVVVGIIAVLVGASIGGFAQMTKSAEKAKAQELVSNVATALTALKLYALFFGFIERFSCFNTSLNFHGKVNFFGGGQKRNTANFFKIHTNGIAREHGY